MNPDNHSKKTEENAVLVIAFFFAHPPSPQVTVIQETLHSVAEMTVQSTSNFTYELNSDIDIVKEVNFILDFEHSFALLNATPFSRSSAEDENLRKGRAHHQSSRHPHGQMVRRRAGRRQFNVAHHVEEGY